MSIIRKITIGSRSSILAIKQANILKDSILNSHPEYQNNPNLISIKTFKTIGDKILNKNINEIDQNGIFTKEIEDVLINNKIDIGVHSMKDMANSCPDSLVISAILKRDDPRDAFISKKFKNINDLPNDAVIGTSSLRRKALILNIRPDLKIVNFRGNIDSRIKKIQNEEVDGTILAVAGLKRINLDNHISSILDIDNFLPAVGQGAIAVEIRKDDKYIFELTRKINHKESEICVLCEREFLKIIDGSCRMPIAGYAKIIDDKISITALIASIDGREIKKETMIGDIDDYIDIGKEIGLKII